MHVNSRKLVCRHRRDRVGPGTDRLFQNDMAGRKLWVQNEGPSKTLAES